MEHTAKSQSDPREQRRAERAAIIDTMESFGILRSTRERALTPVPRCEKIRRNHSRARSYPPSCAVFLCTRHFIGMQRLINLLLRVGGFILLVPGFVLTTPGSEVRSTIRETLGTLFVPAVVFAVAAFPIGLWLTFRVRKTESLGLTASMRNDTRPPVLYLRTFETDRVRYSQLVATFVAQRRIMTLEESLAKIFDEVGPFVAIGRPGEALPTLGAARGYYGQEWKSVVIDLIQSARLVVMRLGVSGEGGLDWELGEVVRLCAPHRFILMIGSGSKADREAYRIFRSKTAIVFPHILPRDPLNALFLSFDDGWRPIISNTRRWPPARCLFHYLAAREDFLLARLRHYLHPVLQSRDIAITPFRATRMQQAILIFGLLGVLGAFILSIFRFATRDRAIVVGINDHRFERTAGWHHSKGEFHDVLFFSQPQSRITSASVSIDGIAPGKYIISVSYFSIDNLASNALVQIFDSRMCIGVVEKDMTRWKRDRVVDERSWADIGEYRIESGFLRVQFICVDMERRFARVDGSDPYVANGVVIVDSVRVDGPIE